MLFNIFTWLLIIFKDYKLFYSKLYKYSYVKFDKNSIKFYILLYKWFYEKNASVLLSLSLL